MITLPLLVVDTCSSYVKIKFNKECLLKSAVVSKSNNPQWNQTFQLEVHEIKSELIFKVYNHNSLVPDMLIGKARVPISTLVINK